MENKEHNLQDKRCECCGYMTYHREHMGCIRAAEQAQQAEPRCDCGDSFTSDAVCANCLAALQQAAPVAAQCRFEGEEWKYCTIAHHLLVQAHPKEWPHYETRALYAQPPAVAGTVPDELTCEDIERLRSALSWEGYSTPESLESCAARWPSLVRDLISGVLDRKKRTLAAAQKGYQ